MHAKACFPLLEAILIFSSGDYHFSLAEMDQYYQSSQSPLKIFKLIYKKFEPHALVYSLVDEQDYKSILVKLTAHV